MRAVIAAIAAAFIAVTPAAADWSLDQMNRTIDQTNFVVNRGCSGTLFSLHDKLVLTNFHCVEDLVGTVEREVTTPEGFVTKRKFRKYEDVPVVQNRYDGFIRTGSSSYVAEIVAESKTRDLAVIRLKGAIPQTYATPLLPDGKQVVRGEVIYIVGNPVGEDATVVQGIVSNVNRSFDFPWTEGARLPMIQMSGGTIGGNSGGALYNTSGELIGVPAVAMRGAVHIGYAIPMEVVKPFLKENCIALKGAIMADDSVNATGGVVVDQACKAAKIKKAEKKGEE